MNTANENNDKKPKHFRSIILLLKVKNVTYAWTTKPVNKYCRLKNNFEVINIPVSIKKSLWDNLKNL